MPLPAMQIVKAIVKNADEREAFDKWYSTDHMPKAKKSMSAPTAWRCWSVQDPSIHIAVYVTDDVKRLLHRNPEELAQLRKEIKEAFPDVTYSLDIVEIVDGNLPALA